nr:hypothetical protein CFP56_07185 [Quercus suber]
MNTNVCFITSPNTYYGNREQFTPTQLLRNGSFTYDAAPLVVDSAFRVGHVLHLCPSWRHNPHHDFGPFLIHKELGNSLSLSSSSISLRIHVDFGRPLFRINRGLGIISRVSSGSGHSNLSFNGWNTGS